jgi:hypothetical protein
MKYRQREISPELLDFLAVHESGHAVMAWKFNLGIAEVSISADMGAVFLVEQFHLYGINGKLSARERGSYRKLMEQLVIMTAAGTVATEIAKIAVPKNAENASDWAAIEELIRPFVHTDMQFWKIREKLVIKCQQLIEDPKIQAAVMAVAQELKSKRRLLAADVEAIIRKASPGIRQHSSADRGQIGWFEKVPGEDSYQLVSRRPV